MSYVIPDPLDIIAGSPSELEDPETAELKAKVRRASYSLMEARANCFCTKPQFDAQGVRLEDAPAALDFEDCQKLGEKLGISADGVYEGFLLGEIEFEQFLDLDNEHRKLEEETPVKPIEEKPKSKKFSEDSPEVQMLDEFIETSEVEEEKERLEAIKKEIS